MESHSPVTAEQLRKALVNRYMREGQGTPTMDTGGAVTLLRDIAREGFDHATLGAAVVAAVPDDVLPPAAAAVVVSVDDCARLMQTISPFHTDVATPFRHALPLIAAALTENPSIVTDNRQNILTIMDQLAEALVGWTPVLGRAGTSLCDKQQEVMAALMAEEPLAEIASSLATFIERDQGRVQKLEERLAASETGRLRSSQSKAMAASMINQSMTGKQLTRSIVDFLEGPWYDSVQLAILTEGIDSEDYSRMKALTETIIWTYQPFDAEGSKAAGDEKQRLYRILEHLPGEVKDLLLSLQHDSGAIEAALELLEQDHFLLVSDQPLEYEEFELLPLEDDHRAAPTVSRPLMKKLAAFEPGQWFRYLTDDGEDRIKLLLKLDDVKQLLFTNRNGMKVMQCSFDVFAYHLSSGTAKPLNATALYSGTFRTLYETLLEEHRRQQKTIAERKARMEEQEKERAAAQETALREAEALAREREEAQRQAQEAARQERLEAAKIAAEQSDAETLEQVKDQVKQLAVGAWLRLPGPDGRLEEAKLAVRISAADKMIFVTQSGSKIGEYTTTELVQMLVAGQGTIQDEGVEFEDTLEQVVSRLRQDRHKSYDDLTGT